MSHSTIKTTTNKKWRIITFQIYKNGKPTKNKYRTPRLSKNDFERMQKFTTADWYNYIAENELPIFIF